MSNTNTHDDSIQSGPCPVGERGEHGSNNHIMHKARQLQPGQWFVATLSPGELAEMEYQISNQYHSHDFVWKHKAQNITQKLRRNKINAKALVLWETPPKIIVRHYVTATAKHKETP